MPAAALFPSHAWPARVRLHRGARLLMARRGGACAPAVDDHPLESTHPRSGSAAGQQTESQRRKPKCDFRRAVLFSRFRVSRRGAGNLLSTRYTPPNHGQRSPLSPCLRSPFPRSSRRAV
ncbi:hypothetical protein MTO96_011633 [Rhipicephalus appendiculatus]